MKKLQKMSLNTMKKGMSRNEMKSIKAGSGGASCDLTVVVCYNYNYKPTNNAYSSSAGWTCCPK
ncbi:hypothetical protein QF023_002808 [Chryseobacterium sp. SLBN-27]|uniref:hypothetical protein n=1 Tax=Chryseobacterium sp. SLBN-27 TaxID=3042287 RepID=UPI002861E60A|nr:hypothetical protein [Chryseobacterium sp. SLBN-27]MDR6159292.1 hypothetical protein [Chryseobacterium sp. SLBN-27]